MDPEVSSDKDEEPMYCKYRFNAIAYSQIQLHSVSSANVNICLIF